MSQPVSAVQFVDHIPAGATRGRTGWGAAEAAALRANPRKIGIIATAPGGAGHSNHYSRLATRVNRINKGRHAPWADERGRFEASIRTVGAEVRIYAQYIPHTTQAAPFPAA